MLFAQKVVLVEGITEKLLLSIMAKYIGKSLEDNHITVINVGGRYFDCFLKLFDSSNPYTIPKKIACLTDRDPERKEKKDNDYEKCYPFEYNQNTTKYDYKNNATDKINQYKVHPNIRFFSQDEYKGKTFEYDLLLYNPTLNLLLTDTMSNQSEIKDLMQFYQENKPVSEYETKFRHSYENKRIKESMLESSFNEDDKKKAFIASRYLNSIGKGENALKLTYALEENLKKSEDQSELFNVPDYIKQAVEWICQ